MNKSSKLIVSLLAGFSAEHLLAADLDTLLPDLYHHFHPAIPGILVGSTNGHRAHFTTATDTALKALNQQLGKDFAVFPFSSMAGAFNFTYDPDLGTFVRTTD